MVPSVCQLLVLAWIMFAVYYSRTYYLKAKEAGEQNPQALAKSIGKGIVFPLTKAVEWLAGVIAKFRKGG